GSVGLLFQGSMKKQVSPSAMNSRWRNVSESPQTIRRCSSRLNEIDELLLKLPIDLVIEIFSRLPLKSIARCGCVSKQWASVLHGPDFTNLDEDSSPIAAVDQHMSFPFRRVYAISSSVNGFVCITSGRARQCCPLPPSLPPPLCITDDRRIKGRKTRELVWVICNLSTRQSFTLPKMKTRKRIGKIRFLGYDPIEKQHKVLAMISHDDGLVEHQVLILRGNGNLTWRMTECGIVKFGFSVESLMGQKQHHVLLGQVMRKLTPVSPDHIRNIYKRC
ncbi:hypothetical protein DY000_02044497, partial [Brassica cretica]